ncbi:hypothetical protein ACOMHN_066617 [Nucella lapillus]
MYMPTLTHEQGISKSDAALLISIIGMANTVGRVLAGYVSDQPWADCLLINNGALVTGGVTTCCVPFFRKYALFAGYSYLFGTCIAVFVSLRTIILVELLAVFVSLRTIILVELLGVDRLTNSFGLLIMFQGTSTYLGAPVAGMLSDLTGDYNISFYTAGTFIALSGLICLPLRRIALWEKERRARLTGLHDLENGEVAVIGDDDVTNDDDVTDGGDDVTADDDVTAPEGVTEDATTKGAQLLTAKA